jgi:hypothetical protein
VPHALNSPPSLRFRAVGCGNIFQNFGGGVWESNPSFVPLRNGSPALKAGKITGLFSPPQWRKRFGIIEQTGINYREVYLRGRVRVSELAFRVGQTIRADYFYQVWICADFVVGARNGRADFSVRQKLANISFADEERLEGVADGN